MSMPLTYVVDIDGTICTNTNGSYDHATPFLASIQKINKLYDAGHRIIYFTARGYTTGIDWTVLTTKQFEDWGVKYHDLICGSKPYADFYIDDKAINASTFFAHSSSASLTFKNKISSFQSLLSKISDDSKINSMLSNIITSCARSLHVGKKIIFCGNGGSYSDSLHLAAEFTGRFKNERCSLPAYVLGSNPSSLTAIANDYNFLEVFSREFSSMATAGDTLICLSTSGNSSNIVHLFNSFDMPSLGINSFLLTSTKQNSSLPSFVDILKIPSSDTAFIQQSHMIIGHYICESLDAEFS